MPNLFLGKKGGRYVVSFFLIKKVKNKNKKKKLMTHCLLV
jgi:hypothetical protein